MSLLAHFNRINSHRNIGDYSEINSGLIMAFFHCGKLVFYTFKMSHMCAHKQTRKDVHAHTHKLNFFPFFQYCSTFNSHSTQQMNPKALHCEDVRPCGDTRVTHTDKHAHFLLV